MERAGWEGGGGARAGRGGGGRGRGGEGAWLNTSAKEVRGFSKTP